MATPHSLRRSLVTALLLIAFVLQGTISVLAGTTGNLNGIVVDTTTSKPVAGARVTAASPSQSATTTSGSDGRFSFISLAPDTYSVSVQATSTRDGASVSGVTVQADQTVNVDIQQPTKLQRIGSVTSRAAAALVKPGTTADVYSINAVTQDKAALLGGGGTLDSAWSAISSVPGVYVQPGQSGYIGAGPTLSIRGGDYNQIGYELDGVPVNRSFDNYPSGSLSSLGQQDLQVYTGAPAANAEANGISGYINQVIRTGTAPATRNLRLGIGTPVLYNKLAFEAGGATPSRTFSYYIGAGAANTASQFYDHYNGASLQQLWGQPLNTCPTTPTGLPALPQAEVPSCYSANGQPYSNTGYLPAYVLGSPDLFGGNNTLQVAGVHARDTVANFHFGLPHKDGNRDDIQILFDNNFINNPEYSSTNDQGGATFLNDIGLGVPAYTDGYIATGLNVGSLLPRTYTGGGVQRYLFPQSPIGRLTGGNCSITTQGLLNGCIEPDRRDAFVNNQSIVKAQYQHNFGTNAFVRVYGYTYYSDWLQAAPQSTFSNYVGNLPNDYELSSHTRGVSLQFSDQLDAKNLLTFQTSYTTASTLRDNNTTNFGTSSRITKRSVGGILVDSSNPLNGICYAPGGGATLPCYNATGSDINRNIGGFTLRSAFNGTVVPASGTCGGGPCQYLVANDGSYGKYNTVKPRFYAASLQDNFKPTDRLSFDLGIRFDRYEFLGADTTGTPARAFFYNAWNRQFPTLQQINVPSQVEGYSEWEPRFGMTYTVDPRTVLRASYGRYAEAPNAAFEQYNFLNQSAPIDLAPFVRLGVGNTPAHAIRPEVSNNYDFSFEHQFGRDTSIKITPFLRKTQDQIQQFYLDQKTNFVSGLNVGRQQSQGVEFELDKGDFSRNGLAARVTFTYTNSYIQYNRESNGKSIVDGINADIAGYNALTKAGGGAPCYTTTGTASVACAAGSIANPYYNAPIQALIDPNGRFTTYDFFPASVGAGGYSSYGAPYIATVIVQYKHGPLAITPAIQFSGGQRYGVPESNPGIDPTTCTAGLAGTTAGDPRYPYGALGGLPVDAANCGTLAAIPDIYTGRFDGVGAFVAPSNLALHTQITYDLNKRVTLVANFANIVSRCFGGTAVPFAVNHACQYGATYGAGSGPISVGNVFNPGDNIQPFLRTPYDPLFLTAPFQMFFEARIKI